MEIEVKALTTYTISEDGESVVFKLVDDTGMERCLRFPLSELGNLVMTLPGLIEAALRRHYRDESFRFAYPIGSWSVEETEADGLILTLRAVDGFGVSFSMARRNAERLGHSIAKGALRPGAMTTHQQRCGFTYKVDLYSQDMTSLPLSRLKADETHVHSPDDLSRCAGPREAFRPGGRGVQRHAADALFGPQGARAGARHAPRHP